MKKIISILCFIFLISNLAFAQVGYVDVDDEIYSFLNRMNNVGIISNYNSFEIPKARKEIKQYLTEIFLQFHKLDNIDQNKLHDFLLEFEIDLMNSLEFSSTMFPEFKLNYLFSDREKYLYQYHNPDGNIFLINFIGKLDNLNLSDNISNTNSNSLLYRFGGKIEGTLYNKVGFSITTTNGSFSGNKNLAQSFSSLRYNYKFNTESESDLGESFFDETSAYLSYHNNFAKIKIGNDRKIIGYGPQKVLLSDNAPRMDYISLDLNYKALEFSFFHGKLLGSQSLIIDDIRGGINKVNDKYLAYHRIGLNISRDFNFAVGEMIIYSNRNLDFSYINPFNFYKSAEHANQDRDNTFLFFDLQNNTIKNLKIYSTILIDDIDFGKIGSGWFGNQSLLSLGVYSSQLYGIVPLEFELQFIKIDPYVYTHRIEDNNFTNQSFNLGSRLQPNSTSTQFIVYYRPHYRLNLSGSFTYSLHGANEIDSFGNTIVNYGGDIQIGHREFDSEKVYLLSGNKEIYRDIELTATYEPIKNMHFTFKLNYSNDLLSGSQHSDHLFTTFSFYTKL